MVTLSRKPYLAKTNVYLVGFWDWCIFVLVQIYYTFLKSNSVHPFQREWVLVLHCDGIQSMVVLYQPEGSVFLFDEEDWRGHRGFGRSDVAGFQIFLQEGIKLLLFGRGEQVDLHPDGAPPGMSSMAWSQGLGSGRTSKDSLENMALNSLRWAGMSSAKMGVSFLASGESRFRLKASARR